jgi:TRAP transporter TAXI family solute receptor
MRVFWLSLVAALLASTAAYAREPLIIGTAPAGSIFYGVGSTVARLLQDELGWQVSPRPYGSSSRYVPLLERDEISMGMNFSLDLALARAGDQPFIRPVTGVRAVGRMFPLLSGFYVRADSDMYTMEDVRGRAMINDMRGSATQRAFIEVVLATGGLTSADIRPVAVAHVVQSMNALIEGRVDVATAGLGIADARRADASIAGGIRALALGSLATDEFMAARMPGLKTTTVQPGPNMAGVAQSIKVATYDGYLSVSAAMSDDMAYEIARTLHTNWSILQRDFPLLRAQSADALVADNHPIDYHPGAIRYYREIGIWHAD